MAWIAKAANWLETLPKQSISRTRVRDSSHKRQVTGPAENQTDDPNGD
jgi:hypothetical protein